MQLEDFLVIVDAFLSNGLLFRLDARCICDRLNDE